PPFLVACFAAPFAAWPFASAPFAIRRGRPFVSELRAVEPRGFGSSGVELGISPPPQIAREIGRLWVEGETVPRGPSPLGRLTSAGGHRDTVNRGSHVRAIRAVKMPTPGRPAGA